MQNHVKVCLRPGARSLLLLSLLILAGGCAGTGLHQTSPETESAENLNSWVDDTLAPYLIRQLGRHPKFKGQPFLLVDMDHEAIQCQVQSRLFDSKPGPEQDEQHLGYPRSNGFSISGQTCQARVGFKPDTRRQTTSGFFRSAPFVRLLASYRPATSREQ